VLLPYGAVSDMYRNDSDCEFSFPVSYAFDIFYQLEFRPCAFQGKRPKYTDLSRVHTDMEEEGKLLNMVLD
jgi:hypothetical protein